MSEELKIAVVTGAGRGIGLSIARRLAKDGWSLDLCGLDEGEMAEAVSELGSAVLAHEVFDLRDRSATDSWCQRVAERHTRVDALVHNAGVGGPDHEDPGAAADWLEEAVSVNATAVFRISRALTGLLPDRRGRVVVIASVLGKMGVPAFSAYCASKAAVLGLVRGMALDLARRGVTVNAICPGWTDTAMAQQGFEALASSGGITPEEARVEVEKNLPLGRIVDPSEVASLVAWLTSEEAGALSGQAITMSAGDLQR